MEGFFSITNCIAFIVQIGIAFYVWRQSIKYKQLFPNGQDLYFDNEKRNLHKGKSFSAFFSDLVDDINDYLQKNEDTVDFAILQNKTERTLQRLYKSAVAFAAFPTYIGLLFTFWGVFSGLNSVRIENGLTDEKTIQNFIAGVSTAMITSFFGLFLTIILQIVLQACQSSVNEKKSNFLNFLQNELMPCFGTGLAKSVTDLRSVISGLKDSFTSVIDKFESTFTEVTNGFGETFRENVTVINKAIDAMGENMHEINRSTELQVKLLNEVKSPAFNKTINNMINLTDRFDNIGKTTDRLAEIQQVMTDRTQTLIKAQDSFINGLELPRELVDKTTSILNRFITFEESVNKLGESFDQSKSLGIAQINEINHQINALNDRHRLVNRYLDLNQEDLEQHYNGQKEATAEAMKNHRRIMETFNEELREQMETQNKELSDGLRQYIRSVLEVVDPVQLNSRIALLDKLKELEHLKKLQELDKLSVIAEKIESKPQSTGYQKPSISTPQSGVSTFIREENDISKSRSNGGNSGSSNGYSGNDTTITSNSGRTDGTPRPSVKPTDTEKPTPNPEETDGAGEKEPKKSFFSRINLFKRFRKS